MRPASLLALGFAACTPEPRLVLAFPDAAAEPEAHGAFVGVFAAASIPDCEAAIAAGRPQDQPLASHDWPYPLPADARLARVPRGRAAFFAELTDADALPHLRGCGVHPVPGDVTLDLRRVNRPPQIRKPDGTALSVLESVTLTIPIVVEDPDGDPFTLAVESLPRFAAYDPVKGAVVARPGPADQGVYTFVVVATESTPAAASSRRDVSLTINDRPRALRWDRLYRGWHGRFESRAVFDVAEKRLVAFGGRDGGIDQRTANFLGGSDLEDALGDLRVLSFAGATPVWAGTPQFAGSPPARFGHAMGIVQSTSWPVAFVVGGLDGERLSLETWLVDLDTPAMPTMRRVTSAGASLPYVYGAASVSVPTNPPVGEAYVFGGDVAGQTYYNDVLRVGTPTSEALDAQATPVSLLNRPAGRSNAAAVLATTPPRRLVIIGGLSGLGGSVHHSDAWVFCLETLAPKCPSSPAWIELAKAGGTVFPGSGAPGVHSMSAGYDPANDRVLVYGGLSIVNGLPWLFEDLWELDLATGAWRNLGIPPNGPLGLVGAAYATDPVGKRLLLYGGLTGRFVLGRPTLDLTEDVWEIPLVLGPPTIRKIATAPLQRTPSRRYHHAVVAPAGRLPIVLGGETEDSGAVQDAWELLRPGAMRELRPPGTSPWPRADFSATPIPDRGEIWVFGGRVSNTILNASLERLVLTPGAEAWESLPIAEQASQRHNHTAVYDAETRRLLVYGGIGGSGPLADVFAITVDDLSAHVTPIIADNPPPGRYGHVAGYDPARRRMLVFGGTADVGGGSEKDSDEVWELSFATARPRWRKITPVGTGPVPMFFARGVLTAENPPRLYVIGTVRRPAGALPAYADGLWELSLAPGAEAWRSLLTEVPVRPRARVAPAVTYDPESHQLLFSGGLMDPVTRNDLWALTLP